MGFKQDKGDKGFPRREADKAQGGSPRREADEAFKLSASNAGDDVFMPTNEEKYDGSLSRKADSKEDLVESQNAEPHNSTLSRQASYPLKCDDSRPSSHFAKKIVAEAFNIYSSKKSRRDAIWRSLQQAKKSPSTLTMGSCLPTCIYHGLDCVYYKGWYISIYYWFSSFMIETAVYQKQ